MSRTPLALHATLAHAAPASHPHHDELLDAIEEYLLECRRLRPATRTWYTTYLGKFHEWTAAHAILTWEQLDRKVLATWTTSLYALTCQRRGTPLQPKSLRARALVVRTFLRWAGQADYCDEGLWQRVRLPKLNRPVIQTLSPAQVARLVAAVPREEPVLWLQRRNQAMLLVLIGTGMRVQELCDLCLADVHLAGTAGGESYLHIRSGKGGKGREVPLPPQAEIALRKYLRLRPRVPSAEWVFLARRREQMSRDGVRQWMVRLEVAAGSGYFEGVRVSPHTCRHTFAVTYLTMPGSDLFRLKELMGHEHIATTQVYLRDFNQRTARLNAPNVLDKLMG